jgi:ribose transport system substrate-binding protein
MNVMRRVVPAIVALSIAWVSGCDRHSEKKEVFYLVASNLATPYWQSAVAGFKGAAAQYRVTARVAGPDNRDPQAELEEFQKAVSAKPAGILISVADQGVLQPAIDAAVNAGVPVITIDSDAAASHRLFFIGTENLEAGRMGARRVVEKLGGKGNVVFFTFAGQPNIEERLHGFKDVFASNPGIKIVNVIDIQSDPRAAFDKAQELMALSGAQKIDAFIALESQSGKPVSDAVQRGGGKDRVVLAWDLNQDTLDAVKAGAIDATVVQKPYTMGFVGLKALDEIFHNPPKKLAWDSKSEMDAVFPEFVDTGTSLVDKSNVDAYIAELASRK